MPPKTDQQPADRHYAKNEPPEKRNADERPDPGKAHERASDDDDEPSSGDIVNW